MRSYKQTTPIIFSKNLNAEAESKSSGIAHGQLKNNEIIIHVPSNGIIKIKKMVMPKGQFRLNHMGADIHSSWKSLIMWLQHEIGANPLLIIDHNHPLREFVIFANAWSSLPYGLRFANNIPAVHALEYALLGNSKINLFTSSELEDDFRKKYIGPYRSVCTEQALKNQWAELVHGPLKDNQQKSDDRTLPAVKPDQNDKCLKLLIVSYFSGPCRAVSVQRINYWLDEIARLSSDTIETHLATAINWGEERQNLHFVADHNVASLLQQDNRFPDWGQNFIASEQKNAKSFNTLSHYWRYALEQYFDQRDDHFDALVISGNPFSCFDFATYAKRRWRARIILDYRDPFANNPRFHYKNEQRQAARYVERGYNFQSDAVLTVNNRCLDYFEAEEDINPAVVENGYNERILKDVMVQILEPLEKVNLVHAGSFYHDRSPAAIIASLDPEQHRFHHIGDSAGIDDDQLQLPQLALHGRQSYLDTLGILSAGHCGVVFLSKTAFETTTKVYDYLAVGIDVLLCTHGQLNEGALSKILKDQEGIFWCHNSIEGVEKFLNSYKPGSKQKRNATDRFSRGHSTKILIEKINELIYG